jgi:hypothetical protein
LNEERLEILKCAIDEDWKVDVENGEIYSKHGNEMLKGSWRGNEFYFVKEFIIGGKRKAFNFKKSNVIAYAAGNDLLGKSVIHINGDKQDNRISNLMIVDDRRCWGDEELVFLKFAYPNDEFTTKEIAEALGRSRKSVIVKASSLNLKRPKKKVEEQDMRTKVCSKCGVEKRISCFHKSDLCKDGHRSVCKSCASEYSKIRAEKKSREMGRVWY